MILDKYVGQMSDKRFYYAYMLVELVRRGHRRQDARRMIEESRVLDKCTKDPVLFNHYPPEHWADYVEQDHQYRVAG